MVIEFLFIIPEIFKTKGKYHINPLIILISRVKIQLEKTELYCDRIEPVL